MPKRAGILTFHCTDNPGSVLQAYALQEVVRSLGWECDILNYQRQGWKDCIYNGFAASLRKKLRLPQKAALAVAKLLTDFSYRKYDIFREQYLSVAPKKAVNDKERFRLAVDGYDKLICGSDQIWNLDNNKVDDIYFLNCTDDRKKIAYAASFGKEKLGNDYDTAIRSLIARIPYLSVREPRGAELVKELTCRDAQVVLDPTLLLTRADWERLAIMPREKDYILVYTRERAAEPDEFAFCLSKKTGRKIIKLTPYRSDRKIGKTVVTPGPREWLGYFLNASSVVTNSFHGMAFSLNFGKQFYCVPLSKTDTNSRLYGLLDRFDLRDRIVNLNDETQLLDMRSICDEHVLQHLAKERRESMEFLKHALEGE